MYNVNKIRIVEINGFKILDQWCIKKFIDIGIFKD